MITASEAKRVAIFNSVENKAFINKVQSSIRSASYEGKTSCVVSLGENSIYLIEYLRLHGFSVKYETETVDEEFPGYVPPRKIHIKRLNITVEVERTDFVNKVVYWWDG
jgi:hypothetical protein